MKSLSIILMFVLALAFTAGPVAADDRYEYGAGKGSYPGKFYGVVESMPKTGYEGLWIIGGRTILVNNKTLVDETTGRAVMGAYAKVKGIREGEKITAYELEIKGKK